MKKTTLLVTAILLTVTAVLSQPRIVSNFYSGAPELDEPIAFNERGIDFFVFPNGEFDFNTHPANAGEILHRKGRRNCNSDFGIPVDYDLNGRVRRIGNVFLNYDYQGRIKRIGSVLLHYNRFALSQIGGMKLIYNRRGEIVNTIGTIKGSNFRYGYCYQTSEDENDGYSSHFFRKKK